MRQRARLLPRCSRPWPRSQGSPLRATAPSVPHSSRICAPSAGVVQNLINLWSPQCCARPYRPSRTGGRRPSAYLGTTSYTPSMRPPAPETFCPSLRTPQPVRRARLGQQRGPTQTPSRQPGKMLCAPRDVRYEFVSQHRHIAHLCQIVQHAGLPCRTQLFVLAPTRRQSGH